MRVIRFLFPLVGLAITAAGCAQRPVAYIAAMPPPAAGIDNVVYGQTAAVPAPASPYAGLYSSAAPPTYTAPAAPQAYRAPAAPQGAYPAAAYTSNGYDPAAFPPNYGSGPYTLDSGDRLRIVVFGQDGLTNSYAVDAGGYIAMPLIGAVPARGATTDELAARISGKLRDGYIREPHVAVEIEAYRPFFILGEVTAPGQYPFVANMTVETAVAIAGGFGPRAQRRTVILNRNFAGRQVRIAVPLTFPLRPGDTINVQERWF
jgi:polysaccharide export outer membrane protein